MEYSPAGVPAPAAYYASIATADKHQPFANADHHEQRRGFSHPETLGWVVGHSYKAQTDPAASVIS
jgi:hypothetical protein